jgi:hypothetical protein
MRIRAAEGAGMRDAASRRIPRSLPGAAYLACRERPTRPYNHNMAGTQAVTALPLHRFDVETYGRMAETGALDGEPLELLEGWLVDMSPQNPDHAAVIARLTRHLAHAQAWLHVQLPLEIPPGSVPEPDLALVAERPSSKQHPRTALLVVEVAVSSGSDGRTGMGSVWYGDAVPNRTVEQYFNGAGITSR